MICKGTSNMNRSGLWSFIAMGLTVGAFYWLLGPLLVGLTPSWQREITAVTIALVTALTGFLCHLIQHRPKKDQNLSSQASTTDDLIKRLIEDAEAIGSFTDIMRGHLVKANEGTESQSLALIQALEDIRAQSDELLKGLNRAVEDTKGHIEKQLKVKADKAETLSKIQIYQEHRKDEIVGDTHIVNEVINAIKGFTTFTEMIHDISTQINILAINASIEAAKVGAMGLGFDVVAKETRKLAMQSKKVAEQIDKRVLEIISMVQKNLLTMVSEERSNKANQYLTMIISDLDNVYTAFGEVGHYLTTFVDESQRAMQQIHEAVLNALGNMQLQDISRQQIEQVDRALQELSEHFKQVQGALSCEDVTDAKWTGLNERIEAFRQRYVMQLQRHTHDKATGTDAKTEEGPKIELF